MKTYKMGLMDKYPVCVAGSRVEQMPTYEFEFDSEIDIEKLKKSIIVAFEYFPYFKCRIRYNKTYYFEEVEGELPIFQCKFEDKNYCIGKNTNHYPFQFTIDKNKMLFEWIHSVADGVGGYNFIVKVFAAYFDDELGEVVPTDDQEPVVEMLEDAKVEDVIPERKQRPGFAIKKLKYIDKNKTCACHELEIITNDIIKFGKASDATPAVILVPLFSRALRMSLDKNLKNRNVKSVFVIDLRRRFNIESRHNFIITKAITYIDEFDKMDFGQVCTIYRTILELATNKGNLIKAVNEKCKELRLLLFLKTTPIIRLFFNKIMSLIKDYGDENVNFTYICRANIGKKAEEHIKDFKVKVYPDFGQICITAIDYKGKINVCVNENIVDKNLIPNFLKLSAEQNIPIKEGKSYLFKSSLYIDEL